VPSRKRACDAEDDRHVLERSVKDRGGAKIERASDQPKRFGDRFDLFDISSGQDRAHPAFDRRLRDEFAGITGRSIDEDGSFHEALSPSSKMLDEVVIPFRHCHDGFQN